MKSTTALLGILAITLALSVNVQAQPTTVNVALTVTYELPSTTSGADANITTSTTRSAKLNSATILKLIEIAQGSDFPAGTYLAQDADNAQALDRAGASTDLSSYISVATGTAATVSSGTSNSDTGKASGTVTIYTVMSFDDGNGNSFTVAGLIVNKASVTATDANGNQTETISFSGNVAGFGTVVDSRGNTDNAVFSGTISGSGKGLAGS